MAIEYMAHGPSSAAVPVGVIRRLWAGVVDAVILAIVWYVVAFVTIILEFNRETPRSAWIPLSVIVPAYAVWEGCMRISVGKLFCGLEVDAADSSKGMRCGLRAAVKYAILIALSSPVIWPTSHVDVYLWRVLACFGVFVVGGVCLPIILKRRAVYDVLWGTCVRRRLTSSELATRRNSENGKAGAVSCSD